MLYAILDGVKSPAIPDANGICPICKKEVFSRCGQVYVWHWAHRAHKGCISDSFVRPDSFFYVMWKKFFGAEKSEILIHKKGEVHIADIVSKDDLVIMLYDSRISKKIISNIEDFFGERMFWVIDAKGQGFEIRETDLSISYRKYFHNTFDIKEGNIVEKETGEVVDKRRMYLPKYKYLWSKSTNGGNTLVEVTKRHVFVDSGLEEEIVYIPKGSRYFGTENYEKCKRVKIDDFLIKYC